MVTEKFLDFIENNADEAYQLLKVLAAIPAPSNHEEKRMRFCAQWLNDNGAQGVYTDSALNVVFPVNVGADNPVVVFCAHTDVVFPDTDPLPVVDDGQRLWAPGVGDDTANLVALMLAAKYIVKSNARPRDNMGVLFVCNSGEEGMGNLKGSRKICDDYQGRITAFYSFDGYLSHVANKAVGSKRFKVEIKAQGGHSYLNFGQTNALAQLAAVISDIYQIETPKNGTTTYNVGVVKGGTSVNTIAQDAQMLCEYRSDSAEDMQIMQRHFDIIFAAHRERGVALTAEVVGNRPGELLSDLAYFERECMVRKTMDLLERVTGKRPKASSSSTDCNIPLSRGIPSVCFGTCYGGGAHTREEYIEIDSLKPGYRAALETVLEYFL